MDDLIHCLWCPCCFFCESDYQAHLKALSVPGFKPNQYDHRVIWRKMMEDRNRYYYADE